MGQQGIFYIVATPIGNLDDISQRALKILQEVDVIAAEDTRHTRKLLDAYQISTKMVSLHEHNETERAQMLIDKMLAGDNVALVSDAGTPLISDPGYVIVNQARQQSIQVVPIPGACAAIAALSAGGLPTDRFLFAGFLPQKSGPRQQSVAELMKQAATTVLYESPRRIIDLLEAIQAVDAQRSVCLAKELTKSFERFLPGTPGELIEVLQQDPDLQRGEWVVLIAPPEKQRESSLGAEILEAVEIAADALPLKKACEVVAKITGHKKNQLYQAVLEYREK
ncbi:MAG: 16S rRNA (cytidine(1402)-2'-O)-methyltransferase [Pseudomonadales bacterium]|nr:16S rRNA (cytidine(1402)-2'-O)-methyltransferase [Pseudomonadales bacterium]